MLRNGEWRGMGDGTQIALCQADATKAPDGVSRAFALTYCDHSYAVKRNGSPGRTRTSDRVVNSHLLYQLSYRGTRRSPKFNKHAAMTQTSARA